MMKIIFFFSAIIFSSLISFSQVTEIADLKLRLENSSSDTGKVNILNEISYYHPDVDSMMWYGKEALNISRSINFLKGESISLNRIGYAYSAIGNYAKSLEYHLSALKTAESSGDTVSIMNSLSNIANDYSYLKNEVLGKSYLFKAIALANKKNDKLREARYMINLGDSYEKLNILDSAKYFTNLGYDISVKLQDNYYTGIALNNLGNIYSKLGQNVIAMANYNLCIPYLLNAAGENDLCEPYLGKAKLFLKDGAIDSSLHYAKLSMKLAKDGGFSPQILSAATFLTDYYTTAKNVDSAFTYQKEMVHAKDSLFSQEKQREIQSLTFDESLRQLQIEEQKMLLENERKTKIQLGIIGIGIISFIVLFLLISQTIIVNEKWIRFLGILALLLVFEFLNLVLHPYIGTITYHSPFFTLLAMVLIASLLIPLHHKLEHWVKNKIVARNKEIRLKAARKIIEELENENASQDDNASQESETTDEK
ncbi:MAG: hypothetical protein JSR00_04725 [Bacteroidetes bacterium]|nr:hypothetical protein [Bacteroidota bacterium]